MKIGLSTSVIQRGRSGVGQYVLALVRALINQESRNDFFLFVLEDDLPMFAFAESAMRIVPVPERFRPPIKDILWHQTMLPAIARHLRLDVLHIPSYRRLLWRRPCAMVATIHDLAPFRLPNKYDRLRMFYGRVVVRQLAKRQDEIIAVSRNTAQDVSQFFGLRNQRLNVIPNGLDHERFQPGPRALAKETIAWRHGIRQPFFLYVARLEHPAKNHTRLIEAFNEFKALTNSPWQLVLGGPDWHGSEAIHAAIRRSPFINDIHCAGFIPMEELPVWYRAADVFVYPSLYEGFGLPPLEAMACGCPVISSTRGALGEVVSDAAVTVNPDDVGQIKHQLARLAGDPGLRERLRAAGLSRARRFDWRNTAKDTLKVYARAGSRTRVPAFAGPAASVLD